MTEDSAAHAYSFDADDLDTELPELRSQTRSKKVEIDRHDIKHDTEINSSVTENISNNNDESNHSAVQRPKINGNQSYCSSSQNVTPTSRCHSVGFVLGEEVLQHVDRLPKITERASMVYKLIEAYGLLKYTDIIKPHKASEAEITNFHSRDYVDFLKNLTDCVDEEKYDEEAQEYGLSYDCPIIPDVYDYCSCVAGSTLAAASSLVTGQFNVAINWYGGWHHAMKDSASGFCYVNDIVLGILKMQEKFNRVLYVDLDLHHGDGVQDAFCATTKVMTVSFHKHSPGFFPGTGGHTDLGMGKAKYYSVNVPLKDGIQDSEFTSTFIRIMDAVKTRFHPDAVVCQCGADGLAGDPMQSFNLTHKSLGQCVFYMLKWALPTLLLGGGGYNHCNTARCWAFITAIALNKKLPPEIPDHEYFEKYGPSFELAVDMGNMKNQNTMQYLQDVCQYVLGNLSKVS